MIDTIEVHAIPTPRSSGRVSGAVASVRTIAGDDHFDVDIGGLIPKLRFRNGTLMGINTATPRIKVSGPLRRGKAWFSQAFSYRFARSQVKEELPGEDEEIVEAFDAFTQIDLKLSDRHSITGTLSVFPTRIDNAGIDSLHPEFATPDTESGGWNVAIADELATGSNTLWQTQLAVRGFDVAVRPKGRALRCSHRTAPPELTSTRSIDGAFRWDWNAARLQSFRWGTQEHLLKIGGQLLSTSFDGIDRSGPHRDAGRRWPAPQANHLPWTR